MIKSKIFTTFLIIILAGKLFSQEVNFTLVSSKESEILIRVDFPQYNTTEIEDNGEKMLKLQMKGAYPDNEAGAPELLKSSVSFMMPDNADATVEILESDFYQLADINLIPSKGRLLRNVDPSTIPYQKGPQYLIDEFIPAKSLLLKEPFMLREITGNSLICYPFQYNPVQKILKVYKSMLLSIKFNQGSINFDLQKRTAEFEKIYKSVFINYQTDRYTPICEEGDLLIIAPGAYISSLQPLADWKIKNGINTEIVALENIGSTSSAIKSYITNYYTQHNLAFVILAGDNMQLPPYTLGGESCDNYYAEISGSDNIPDILLGRISAENTTHISTQVQKFIQYEQNPPETSHFPVFCGIASEEGPGDNNEYDYQHIRGINNLLASYTYTSGYEFFEGNQGGLDASGDPTGTMVANALNNGVGILNYCGHGSYTSFGTSNFSSTYINSLSNNSKLPFIISVACQNGDYVGRTCFAESWLRSANNNQLTGAVSVLMSSINQPWNPPMAGQDEMNKILTESVSGNIKRAFGGIVFDGLLKMLEVYNDVETYRTWLIFGDPSLTIRTAVPETLIVNHPESITVGTQNITFTSPVEGAKIVLSANSQILSQGYIINGSVTLSIPILTIQDTIRVLASQYNHIPYQSNIHFHIANAPWLVYNSHSFSEISGNQNHLPDYDETVNLSINLKNTGLQSAQNITLKLRTNDSYITLLDTVSSISQINAGSTGSIQTPFKFRIANNVPYGHIVDFKVILNYNNNSVSFNLPQLIYAPNIDFSEMVLDDSGSSVEENNRLDLGESCTVKFSFVNNGNSATKYGNISLVSTDGKISISDPFNLVPMLSVDQSHITSFDIRVKQEITEPTTSTLQLKYRHGAYQIIREFPISIGVDIEDWESGTFIQYPWANNATYPWKLTETNCFEGSFSARSYSIGNNQSSQLSISINVANPDTISFYYYVSSEAGNGSLYDRLEFHIDNNRKAYWDGETGWQKASFPVTSGNHTFYWKYVKDSYVSEGEDMAMIDLISLPGKVREASVSDIDDAISVSVFPNPATDILNIEIDDFDTRAKQVELWDVYGRIVITKTLTNNKGILDLRNFAGGIYLVVIQSEDKILNINKIIKK